MVMTSGFEDTKRAGDLIEIAHEKNIFPNKQAINNNCAF
jgi:hypothetical protein